MLPKYSELDLTPFFAPFFMVFFGLCLGDSGYGLFLFLAATLYRMFAKNISATIEADSFIGTDTGCLYILLWNADRYVLRGKSL